MTTVDLYLVLLAGMAVTGLVCAWSVVDAWLRGESW